MIKLFYKSLTHCIKSPLIFIPALALFLFFILFSKLSTFVNQKLTNTFALTAWLVFFISISFIVMSYVFSGLIGITMDVKKFFYIANKYWIKNIPIMLLIAITSFLIIQISTFLGLLIGKSLNLAPNAAAILFFVFLFAGLSGILIFFSFSSFYLVIYDNSILNSVKSSIKFVKRSYIRVLSVLVIFFIIFYFLDFFSKSYQILGSLLESAVAPYLTILLTNLIKNDLSA